MQVYVIDPHDREVRVAEYDGKRESIYKLAQCRMLYAVRINYQGDVLYVDDVGQFKPLDEQAFFMLDTYSQPLAGFGVVIGSDEDGNDTAPYVNIEEIKSRVRWLSTDEAVSLMS